MRSILDFYTINAPIPPLVRILFAELFSGLVTGIVPISRFDDHFLTNLLLGAAFDHDA